LVFRRVLPSHLFYYLGGSFFCVGANLYHADNVGDTAHLTFQLLYDPVANGLLDVANLQPRATGRTTLMLFLGLSIGKKSPW
jgi:hypothetical protein